MRESVHQSIANFSVRASTQSDLPKGNSVLGQVHGVHIDTQRDDADRSVLDQTLGDRSGSVCVCIWDEKYSWVEVLNVCVKRNHLS